MGVSENWVKCPCNNRKHDDQSYIFWVPCFQTKPYVELKISSSRIRGAKSP